MFDLMNQITHAELALAPGPMGIIGLIFLASIGGAFIGVSCVIFFFLALDHGKSEMQEYERKMAKGAATLMAIGATYLALLGVAIQAFSYNFVYLVNVIFVLGLCWFVWTSLRGMIIALRSLMTTRA